MMTIPLVVQHIQSQFETLALDTVPQLAQCYALDARFKDPFNTVQGRDKIAQIFTHMFEQVQAPRFVVTKVIVGANGLGHDVFLRWDFQFNRQGEPQLIVGATHLALNEQGLIQCHDDYWDAAEQVYEHVPVLGGILRWIKRKLSAHTI